MELTRCKNGICISIINLIIYNLTFIRYLLILAKFPILNMKFKF